MALRIEPLFMKKPPLLPKMLIIHYCSFQSPSMIVQNHMKKLGTRISCSNGISDAELASDLASKVAKFNTHLLQREEAMKKGRELLFAEFCDYLGLKTEEVKVKWRKVEEDEKWVLIRGFVSSEWASNFHPLSARSAKEMVEEYLQGGTSAAGASPPLFPGLKRMMGFSQNKPAQK